VSHPAPPDIYIPGLRSDTIKVKMRNFRYSRARLERIDTLH
jgi:hypothetical protein